MITALEKLDAKVTETRKQLDKATAKRDDAINVLSRSVAKIKETQRTLARLEKKRSDARTAERSERRAAASRKTQEPMPQTL